MEFSLLRSINANRLFITDQLRIRGAEAEVEQRHRHAQQQISPHPFYDCIYRRPGYLSFYVTLAYSPLCRQSPFCPPLTYPPFHLRPSLSPFIFCIPGADQAGVSWLHHVLSLGRLVVRFHHHLSKETGRRSDGCVCLFSCVAYTPTLFVCPARNPRVTVYGMKVSIVLAGKKERLEA